MKIFFWLLVAVNLIFFTVMKLQGGGPTAPVPLPLHAEMITLENATQHAVESVAAAPVVAGALPVVPASAPVSILPVSSPVPAAAPPDVARACFEWGDFAGADLVRVTAALKTLQLGANLSQREVDRSIGFWVYIAPLKDKAAVGEKLAQLKARGVTDYFVVQDAGEWLNAISLGVFKTRESAQKFLQGLRANDIRTAQMGVRSGKSRATVFAISGLNAQMSDKFTALQKDFPDSEQKRVSCH